MHKKTGKAIMGHSYFARLHSFDSTLKEGPNLGTHGVKNQIMWVRGGNVDALSYLIRKIKTTSDSTAQSNKVR